MKFKLRLFLAIIFAVSASEAIAGPKWSNWINLGKPINVGSFQTGQMKAILSTDGRLSLFVLGSDSKIWHTYKADIIHWQYVCTDHEISEDLSKKIHRLGCDPHYWATKGTSPPEWCSEDPETIRKSVKKCKLHSDFRYGWSTWQVLGDGTAVIPFSEFVVGQNLDGQIEVFAKSDQLEIWHIRQTGVKDKWNNWQIFWSPQGNVVSLDKSLAVGHNKEGRLVLFVLDGTDYLWQRSQTPPNNVWSNWMPFKKLPDKNIENIVKVIDRVGENKDGRMELFAISGYFHHGWYDTIWHTWQNDTTNAWSDWTPFPKATTSESSQFVRPLTVAKNKDDRLELFTLSIDLKDTKPWNRIYHIAQDSSSGEWTQWKQFADFEKYFKLSDDQPFYTIDLSLVKNNNGYMELFTISSDFRKIWYITQTFSNHDWGTWMPLDNPEGVTFKEVITSQNKNGNVEVLALSDDSGVWNRTKLSL